MLKVLFIDATSFIPEILIASSSEYRTRGGRRPRLRRTEFLVPWGRYVFDDIPFGILILAYCHSGYIGDMRAHPYVGCFHVDDGAFLA
jgi:hypothetical protein